ncbi:MAG: hypothetical protein LN413_06995 [Candidatus Thermoplasmatota archaeon]|nr:hypothetical protein [Candidatus Thermoplasmatota archaeon]
MKHVPWTVAVTVPSIVVVVVVSLFLGYELVAAGAAGALAGYLGKLNGSS